MKEVLDDKRRNLNLQKSQAHKYIQDYIEGMQDYAKNEKDAIREI